MTLRREQQHIIILPIMLPVHILVIVTERGPLISIALLENGLATLILCLHRSKTGRFKKRQYIGSGVRIKLSGCIDSKKTE